MPVDIQDHINHVTLTMPDRIGVILSARNIGPEPIPVFDTEGHVVATLLQCERIDFESYRKWWLVGPIRWKIMQRVDQQCDPKPDIISQVQSTDSASPQP